jgi:peptidoglycan hydrolase-like protein with peptidoglycan-binding domain
LASKLARSSSRALSRILLVASVAALMTACLAGTALADNPSADSGAMSAEIILKKGDRGSAVSAVQRKLGLTADGRFGAGTQRAVKRFQRRSHITADGIVGPATRRALRLRPFTSRSVRRGKGKAQSAPGGIPAVLERIAQCESGGDPTAVSRNGQYFGKYQFSKATWKAQGGQGDNPAEASEAEQDRVALELYKAQGTDPWPTCGASA